MLTKTQPLLMLVPMGSSSDVMQLFDTGLGSDPISHDKGLPLLIGEVTQIFTCFEFEKSRFGGIKLSAQLRSAIRYQFLQIQIIH